MILPPEMNDKAWRLAHLYSIVTKQGERRRLTPNIVQQKLLASPSKRKMILKARQMGVSTGCLIDQYDNVVTTPNLTAVIIAHEQDAIRKLFRIPQRAYAFSEKKVRPLIGRGGGSQYEMFFPKLNSRLYCDLEVRSDTVHDLHVSEAAFIKDGDKLKATLNAVPITTGRVTLESTPNGMSGLFYEMWNDADQPYEKFFFPWFIFPEYQLLCDDRLELTDEEKDFVKRAKSYYGVDITPQQIAFRRYKQVEQKAMFMQEYPENDRECFLSSGSAAMDLMLLSQLMEMAKKPYHFDGVTALYERYNNSQLYACGVDTAEGIGNDWSVASMFHVQSRTQVGLLAVNRMKPYDFAHLLAKFCERWTEYDRPYPLLGVERNNHGHAVLQELEEHILYPNLYHRPIGSDGERDDRPGWVTDKVTRPLMIDTFIDGVEHRSVTLHDQGTFKECMTLVNNEGKIEADAGHHDDRVIASAIAVQMVVESGVSALYDNISDKIKT